MKKKVTRVKGMTFDHSNRGPYRPRMSEAQKNFIRGYACCLANAINLEDWRYSQIGGGVTIAEMEMAGVEPSDLETIKAAQKIGD